MAATGAHEDHLERLWDVIMRLADARKVTPIKDKVWIEHVGGKAWTLVVNGTKKNHVHDGFKILPYNAAIWWGDWLAGSFSPVEGMIAAGSLANVDTFISAVEKEIS